MKRNNIYLGDAYELIKQLKEKSIDCIYTDIPYDFVGNGKLSGGAPGIKKKNYYNEYKRVAKTRGGTLAMRKARNSSEIAEFASGIDFSILDEFVRVMKKVNLFIWCSKAQILPILNYFDNENIYFEILVWCKTNPIPTGNNAWLSDIEYCLYIREKGVRLNDGYDLKSKWFISHYNKDDKDLYDHPTIKPFDCVRNHLLHATQKGDVVLDPFLGSGTTADVCRHIKRDYIGFELDENYYEIAKLRLKGITQVEKKIGAVQLSLFEDIDF